MCVRAQTNTFRWFMLAVPATYCEACEYTVARRGRKLIMKRSVANQNREAILLFRCAVTFAMLSKRDEHKANNHNHQERET